ncbi:MAG: hypothetical protein IH881_19135 [Myxococcales bacterium]|nr:hypothetical protein [Myxococcales bacterium]
MIRNHLDAGHIEHPAAALWAGLKEFLAAAFLYPQDDVSRDAFLVDGFLVGVRADEVPSEALLEFG